MFDKINRMIPNSRWDTIWNIGYIPRASKSIPKNISLFFLIWGCLWIISKCIFLQLSVISLPLKGIEGIGSAGERLSFERDESKLWQGKTESFNFWTYNSRLQRRSEHLQRVCDHFLPNHYESYSIDHRFILCMVSIEKTIKRFIRVFGRRLITF